MGAIGGLTGLAGGAAGSGFAGPATANITNPVTQDQINTSYGGTQNSMQSQQALLAALQAQNGIQNQSNVYNQLQGVAAGTGPNPAQAMLAQSTGANVANQAALMAGQRGAAGNVGMMARQAGMQGGALQQQAAGQAATMQANQSLNAINAAGNMANTQAGNQIGQTNANTQAQLAEQNALINAQTAYNNAQVGMQSNINNANASLAGGVMKNQSDMLGGIMGGAAAAAAAADGGDVASLPVMAFPAAASAPIPQQPAVAGPQSKFGQFLKGASQASPDNSSQLKKGTADATKQLVMAARSKKPAPPVKNAPNAMAGEPTPIVDNAALVARGGMIHDYRVGGGVNAKNPSQKAVKPGNSYANDKIPAILSEGEVVIPRSVMQGKDPVNGSAKFVQAVLAKRRMRK